MLREVLRIDISVIGSDYVGTTIASGFANLDHNVTNVDIDQSIMDASNDAEAAIHEDGLPNSSTNMLATIA
jgi:UDPglucose 6-dehydrogenase